MRFKSLSTKNLSKKYDNKTVINNVTISLPSNGIFGVLGKNGAGKTTFLAMLMGLIKPTSGNISIFEKSLESRKYEILKEINFQSPYVELPKKMTVEQNLSFYSRLYGVKNFSKVIEALVNELKINDLLKKNYGSLSAGQKTKINLCKALLNKPKLLLLDEPTASLDPETSIFIRNYLLEYQKKNSSSILITSHNLNEVQAMCSNIILLKSGEIVSQGNINKILKNYNYKTLIELFLSEG